MLDASAQVRKAQENLEKMVQDEIKRQTKLWRMKVALLLRERELVKHSLREVAEFVNCPSSVKSTMATFAFHDDLWFPGTNAADYAKLLEDS